MWNSPMMRIGILPSIAGRRARMACVITSLLAASVGAESAPQQIKADSVMQETRMDSGLHTYYPGHVVNVMVTETGALRATSQVKIVVRNAADQVVGRIERTLQRGSPVLFEMLVPKGTDRIQVRLSVVITTELGLSSAPVVVLEDLNPDALTAEPRVFCGPPAGRTGAQTLCPGWQVTDITTGS
jgi:hypothetical protein